MTALDDLTPLQCLDVALVQLCGLQVTSDASDSVEAQRVVDAIPIVLDALLEHRQLIPLQRADTGDTPTRVGT
ncbi:MAG: hypothetical protein JWM40_2969 [Frankiales bacterium]|nr:hypothetical protein [Frankiales bacterium]